MPSEIQTPTPRRHAYSPEQLDQLNRLKNLTIMHDRVQECLRFLYDVLDNADQAREAELYTIVGPPGSSKTTSVAYFIRENPPFQIETELGQSIVVYPTLRIEVPPGVGRNGLWHEILVALGRDIRGIPRSGDALRTVAREALREHRVRVLFIDEAQNLIFHRTETAVIRANEVLRALVNANLCQIVLVGVEELNELGRGTQSQAIRVVEQQLGRRILGRQQMTAFNPSSRADSRQFAAVISALEKIACTTPEHSKLVTHLPEFFAATDGATAEAVKLITAAAKISFRAQRTYIIRSDLWEAFRSRRGSDVPNPFGDLAYAARSKPSPNSAILKEMSSLHGRSRELASDFSK